MKRRNRQAAADRGGRLIGSDRLGARQDERVDRSAQRGRESGDRAERIQSIVCQPLRYDSIIPHHALTVVPAAIKTSHGSRKSAPASRRAEPQGPAMIGSDGREPIVRRESSPAETQRGPMGASAGITWDPRARERVRRDLDGLVWAPADAVQGEVYR